LHRGAAMSRACLCAALLTALSAPARADSLDRKLLEVGPQLIKHCRDKGCKTVGTLKFQVKLGPGPARLDVEPLCSNLADRVENLLGLPGGPDERTALGVLHSAGPAAALRDARATYATAEGRKELLAGSYPLAWGGKKASPDAFLTGTA